MKKPLRYFFIVQHKYHDPVQAVRAGALLPFISGSAILLLGFNLLMATNLFLQPSHTVRSYALGVGVVSWVCGLLAVWLVQHGQLRYGVLLVGGVLAVYTVIGPLISDQVAVGVVLPLIIIYASLSYGTRGTLSAYFYALAAILGTAVIRDRGWLGAQQKSFRDALENIAYTAVGLGIAAWMLWLFTRSLQRSLLRANRIAAYTHATTETGQILARILNMDELLTRAVELIRDRFAFYHVQIFLVDAARTYANLVASTGEIGYALLAQGFRVPIGPRTVVGESIADGQLLYVGDMAGQVYRRPELLADTRTELAVPLVARDEVVGALSIYSMRPHAFAEEDIETIRLIANQVSQAIQNAQLFEAQQRGLLQNRRLFLESETNLREIQRLNRQLTGEFWQEYMLERDPNQFGVQLTGPDLRLGPVDWTAPMQQAADRQQLISREEGGEIVLAVPIVIRGQPIGAIEVRLSHEQSQDEIRNILQAVAERMAFSLENARLFEQARAAAQREQQINVITARLQGLTSIEDVLSTAVSALSQTLGAEQGTIRLVPLEPSDTVDPGNGQYDAEVTDHE